MERSPEFEVLNSMFYSSESYEWAKWEYDDVFPDFCTKTLCDVRRHVESVLGEKLHTDLEILEAIRATGGRVTNRPETETADWAFVNLDGVVKHLKK